MRWETEFTFMSKCADYLNQLKGNFVDSVPFFIILANIEIIIYFVVGYQDDYILNRTVQCFCICYHCWFSRYRVCEHLCFHVSIRLIFFVTVHDC